MRLRLGWCALNAFITIIGLASSPRVLCYLAIKMTMTTNNIQAIIFTHCARLRYDEHNYETNKAQFIEEYTQSFMNYLGCNKDTPLIRDVYVYIDQGMKELMTSFDREVKFTLDLDVLRKEQILKDILIISERNARQETGMGRDRLPQFHFVGLNELVGLLTSLWEVDSKLIESICSKTRSFTYDSPKFVEAVIRLARGDIPSLSQDPIIRVDDDAEVNSEAIRKLFSAFKTITNENPFYFFSGKYGRRDGVYDPINDYAVRTHWFFPEGTKPGDENFSNSSYRECIEAAETFLSDLTVLGARQPIHEGQEHRYSLKLQSFVANGSITTKPRRNPQVISGAGLTMSRRSVALLPPFMNFSNLITWVDDHLKRELHERLGDISETDTQCVTDALFQQERHTPCLTNKEIRDTDNGVYFKRLLQGCIFSSIIMDDTETKTYCDYIRDIITYRMQQSEFTETMRNELKNYIASIGTLRYTLVLECWTSIEFRSFSSYIWADIELNNYKNNKSIQPIPSIVTNVIDDAIDYIDLLFNWHKFTRAVERTKFIGNAWLYF